MEIILITKKTCSKCGRGLPITDFHRNRMSKDGRQRQCRECYKQRNKEKYINNPEYFKRYKEENRDRILLTQRECNFLYSAYGRKGGYLRGTGICIFCGEVNPFKLELHHPFGPEDTFKIHECGSCHTLQHRFPLMLEVAL